ncbi:MAG: CidA/LrgA family protein [Pontibacterium sp.]
MSAVKGFLVLLAFQYAGELIAYLAGLPIPGAVIGMLLLLITLIWYGKVPDFLRSTSMALLAVLSLLLVPPSVGLVAHLEILQDNALAITTALIFSTLLPMVLVAYMLKVANTKNSSKKGKAEGER